MNRKMVVALVLIGVVIGAAVLIARWWGLASEREADSASSEGVRGADSVASGRDGGARAGGERLASGSRMEERSTEGAGIGVDGGTSGTLAGKPGEEPIWFVDIAPVEPGQYPYWIVRDEERLSDTLNPGHVNPDKRSILTMPPPAASASLLQSPQNMGGKKIRFHYRGRMQRSLRFISEFRGEWWGIDEFQPQNDAAKENWQEVLKDSRLGAVSGVVIGPDRVPIGGARVRATRDLTPLRTVECGRDGRFRIDRLSTGSVTLAGRAFGFEEGVGQPAVVKAGADSGSIEIVLKPTSIVMGKVTDESGTPIANAEIVAASKNARGYGFMGILGPSVFTDAAGIYSHGSLAEGQYEFLAKAAGYAQAVQLGIEVAAGKPRQQVDFRLNAGGSQPGKVVQEVNGKDEPVAGATVQMQGKLADAQGKVAELARYYQTCTSGPDGAFEALHIPYNNSVSCWAEPMGMDPMDMELASMDSGFIKKVGIRLSKGSPSARITLRLPETGMILGRVVNPEKKPVAGATVAVVDATITPMVPITRPVEEKYARSQKTDSEGRFAIKGLSPKVSYGLRAEAPEFAPSFVDKVTPGKTEIEIVLNRGGALTGKVLDGRSGKPAGGIALKALMENTSRAYMQDAQTAPDGSFRFSTIPVGQYRIGGRGGSAGGWMVVQPQLNLRVEEGRDTEVALKAWPGVAIRGTVVNSATHAPVANAAISAKWQAPSGAFTDTAGGNWLNEMVQSAMPFSTSRDLTALGVAGSAKSSDTGAFEMLALAFGKWELAGKAENFMDASLTVELPNGQNLENVEILMAGGGTIKGIVLDAKGKPVAGARVQGQMQPNLTNLANLQLTPKSATTDAEGRFSLGGLALGKYNLQAFFAGTQVQSDPVSLSFWKPLAEVTLQASASAIRGKVTDTEGNPLEGVILIAMSAKNMMVPAGNAITDSDGKYAMEGVSPGEYTLRAMRNMSLLGDSKKVTVVAGTPLENVDFVIGGGKTLRGLVVDLNAKPMPGWTIQAIAQSAGGSMEDMMNSGMNLQATGSDGKFELSGLKEGKYFLHIMQINLGDMGQMVFKSDAFDLGEEQQIFILPVGGEVRGRLVASDGARAIPSADFYLELKAKYNRLQPQGRLCISQGYQLEKRAMTLGDGRFQFPMLPVGTYSLQIGSEKYGNKIVDRIDVSSEGPTDLGDIVLSQGKTLTGRLIDGATNQPHSFGGNSIPGLRNFGMQAFMTRIVGEEMSRAHGTEEVRANLIAEGSDGSFRIEGAPADARSLAIYSPDHLLLEVAPLPQAQSDVVNLGTLRLQPGETLECTLAGPNGEAVPYAMVVAVCEGRKLPGGLDLDVPGLDISSFFKFNFPFGEESGKITLKGLYPGPAYLMVYNTATNKPIMERQNIVIKAGGHNTVNMALPASGSR